MRTELIRPDVVAERRRALGTQQAVAAALDISARTVARYESEGAPPLYWHALLGLEARARRARRGQSV